MLYQISTNIIVAIATRPSLLRCLFSKSASLNTDAWLIVQKVLLDLDQKLKRINTLCIVII
jgi:hypothetical protein